MHAVPQYDQPSFNDNKSHEIVGYTPTAHPEDLIKLPLAHVEGLRRIGLSKAKIKYITAFSAIVPSK